MGQKLKDDKIGTLSRSTTTFTMGAALLTIGGQQYRTTTNTTYVASGLVANRLYKVYAVRSSGNTILTASLNDNSVGPAGFTSWKLVGAFFTNSAVQITSHIPPIDTPIDIDFSITAGNAVSLNSSVAGYVPVSSNSDETGIIVNESGTYDGATGNYSVQNPRFTMPCPGIFTTTYFELGWSTTGNPNFTHTWQIFVLQNGSQIGLQARNGDGGNGSGSGLSFMTIRNSFRIDATTGDFFEFKPATDLGGGPHPVNIRSAVFNFKTRFALKDL